MRVLRFKLNGDAAEIAAPDHWTLLEVLRYRAGLTGSKQGCDKGDCGACTLHVDGKAILSCITLAADADGHAVTTVEGLVGKEGPDVVQDCFDLSGCLQCGFCQPGMIMAARQLVTENPRATRQEIKAALSSNLCRCTGYTKIFEAVEDACRRTLEKETGRAKDLPTGRGAKPRGADAKRATVRRLKD